MRFLIFIISILATNSINIHAQVFSNEMSKVDPELWSSLDYWKSKEETLTFKISQNRELFGKVIACAGECELYRSYKPFLIKDGGNLFEGDEIRVFEDSHLWLVNMAGDLIRLYPNTSISLNEINFQDNKVMSYIRVNYGGISRVKRDIGYQSFYSGPDSDLKVLPLKISKANYSYWQRDNIKMNAADRFHHLNKILDKKTNYESMIYLLSANITLKAFNTNFHFYHKDRSKSYWYFDSDHFTGFNRAFKNREIPKRALKWFEVSKDGTKVVLASFNDLEIKKFNKITSKIAGLKIAREHLLKDIWGKKASQINLYLNWSSSNYNKRIKYLDSYTLRLERSFLLSSLKLGASQNKFKFSPTNLYQEATFSYEDTLFRNKHLQKTVKNMGELEYKLWASSRARVR